MLGVLADGEANLAGGDGGKLHDPLWPDGGAHRHLQPLPPDIRVNGEGFDALAQWQVFLQPHGVDTFDSAFPSRNGRHGTLFTTDGHIRIKNSKYASLHEPISPYLPHTASYLHHLVKASEPVAGSLFTRHNLCFMQDFMRDLRRRILANEI